MEIDYIKAHMVIERYVQGKLTDDEETEFEERLVWDQALQEEVDLAETLRNWMHETAEESATQISETEEPTDWIPGPISQWGQAARVMFQPAYAAAASFVLGIALTFSVLQGLDNEIQYALDESSPSMILPLMSTRSTVRDPQPVPVVPGAITMLLIDVPDATQRFNVVVRNDASGEVVWTQDNLPVSYLLSVAVGIPGSAVPPGTYVLTIESTNADFRQETPFRTEISADSDAM